VIRLPYSGFGWIPRPGSGSLVTLDREDGATWVVVPRSHVEPSARNTDPVTSHMAAKAQTPAKVRSEHRLVLELLAMEPMSDFQLAALASQHLGRLVKSVSLGVRRGELVRLGLVRDSGKKAKSDTGSACIVWELTQAGRKEVAA
jgi:hypothetical protein